MKGLAAAAYFFALGWYVRATGLDDDLMKIAADSYKLAVLHTVKIVRESRALERERDREQVAA